MVILFVGYTFMAWLPDASQLKSFVTFTSAETVNVVSLAIVGVIGLVELPFDHWMLESTAPAVVLCVSMRTFSVPVQTMTGLS